MKSPWISCARVCLDIIVYFWQWDRIVGMWSSSVNQSSLKDASSEYQHRFIDMVYLCLSSFVTLNPNSCISIINWSTDFSQCQRQSTTTSWRHVLYQLICVCLCDQSIHSFFIPDYSDIYCHLDQTSLLARIKTYLITCFSFSLKYDRAGDNTTTTTAPVQAAGAKKPVPESLLKKMKLAKLQSRANAYRKAQLRRVCLHIEKADLMIDLT